MEYRDKVRPRRARSQWRRLVRTLEQAGAAVEVMEPTPVSSALPFTADGALCFAPGRALVLRNDGPRGELEPPVFRAWLTEHGYEVEALPPECRLDGGNLLPLAGGDVMIGVKPRGPGPAERYLTKLLGLVTGTRAWQVGLRHERHLHLDTALGVLDAETFLVYRSALEQPLPNGGPLDRADLIEIGDDDARAYACNLVVVGDVAITGKISAPLASRIEERGYTVERLDLSEFHKAGGGAKCLTLALRPADPEPMEIGGQDD